ncbi:MAG: glycosyltransferase family 2 protein [Floccifex sp.]
MKEKILVSLIVAVHNGEKYIACCMDSIRKQTYQNFEVILVDDGSKDCSGEICDHYAAMDSRFRVVHQSNHGCSAARNIGLLYSKGDYIGIIDQDDCLHEKYIEYFMKLMIDNDSEIATTDTILPFIGDAPASEKLDDSYSVWSGDDTAKAMLMYTLQIGPWNKLIKKSLIEREKITFQEQFYCGEGFAFSVECFQATAKVVVGHQNVYFYRIDNATSGSSTFSLRKYESSISAQDYMRNVLHDKSRYADDVLEFSKWRTISDNFTLLKASGEENKYLDIYKNLKIQTQRNALSALKIPVKRKQKIRALAFWIAPEWAALCFSKYLNHKMGGKFQNRDA